MRKRSYDDIRSAKPRVFERTMVHPVVTDFVSVVSETGHGQEGDVLWCEAKAQESLVIDVAKPEPYSLLRRIAPGLNKPAYQGRLVFSASEGARPDMLSVTRIPDFSVHTEWNPSGELF